MGNLIYSLGQGNVSGGGCGPLGRVPGVPVSAPPPVEEAMENLEQRKTQCEKRIEFLTGEIKKFDGIIVQFGKSQPVKAKQALLKKKLYNKEIESKNGELEKIILSLNALQQQQSNIDTVQALDLANQALRAFNTEDMVKQADEVTMDLETNIEAQQEMGQIMAKPVNSAFSVNEDDLEEEMRKIQEASADPATETPPMSRLPPVPKGELPVQIAPPVQPRMMAVAAGGSDMSAAQLYTNRKPAAASSSQTPPPQIQSPVPVHAHGVRTHSALGPSAPTPSTSSVQEDQRMKKMEQLVSV